MTFCWRRNVRVCGSTIPGADRGVRGGRPGFSPRSQQSSGWHPNSCSSQGATRRSIRTYRGGARANRCGTGSWARRRVPPAELLNKGTSHGIWTTEQEEITSPELLGKRTSHATWSAEQVEGSHLLNYWTRGDETPPELLKNIGRRTTSCHVSNFVI